ncbi:MAG: hypothetical protein WD054_00890 [Gemmatimonadota bacterium]
MAEQGAGAGGVLVEVCIECGKEYMFEQQEPPEDLKCDKCGNVVFRSFYAQTRTDEVAQDFRDSTDRDTGTTDSAAEVTRGDLQDLSNL